MRLMALLCACALSGAATAQVTQVVPPAYENTAGTGVFLGPLTSSQRTYQLLMDESLLTDLVGLDLTGISWRLPASAVDDWPIADQTFDNYDIYLSESVDPGDRSLTFADNIVGTQTQVRSGSLVIGAGTFPSGGSPNDFGLTIGFGSNYTYNGGNLLLEIRHDGSDGTSRAIDALVTSTPGYGTLFSAAWTGNYLGTSGTQGNFAIVQFTAVPAPGAGALLGLGLLAGARRRR